MNSHNKNYNTIPAVSEAQANLLALASHAAYEYGDNRLVKDSSDQAMFQNGYKIDRELTDPETGFHAKVYKNEATNAYIVAYAGTEGVQDAYSDALYGRSQFYKPIDPANEENNNGGLSLNDYLVNEINPDSISFTGHSLGGALAQYGAYEYVQSLEDGEKAFPSDIALTSYNGLGGLAGIQKQKQEAYDPDMALLNFKWVSRIYSPG